MKKGIGLFLFLCLTAPFLFSYSWFAVTKMEIRNEVKQMVLQDLAEEELVKLKFTKAEAREKLHWEKADEFEYQDQMYDVVEMATIGDSIHYICYKDYKETSLNRKITELVSKALGQNQSSRDSQKRLFTFLQSLYLPCFYTWNQQGFDQDETPHSPYRDFYTSPSAEPHSPPPRVS